MSPSCAAGLSRVGLLAGVMRPVTSNARGGTATRREPGATFEAVASTLRLSGVSALLSSMPVNRQAGETAALSGLLATILRTFQVNLLAPNAASQLQTALQRACLRFPSYQANLPRIPAHLLPAMTQLGGAAVALRRLNVDLFSATGAKQLQALLAKPEIKRTVAALERQPLSRTTSNRLATLAAMSRARQSLSQLSGQLPTPPSARMGTATLGTLQSAQLGSLWRGISSGTPGPQIKLPDAGHVAELNAQKAAGQLLQKSAGLNPSSPTYSKEIEQILAKFRASGICQVIGANPIEGQQMDALERFASFHSSLGAVHEGLQVNLLEKGAGAGLSRHIGSLQSASQLPAPATTSWVEVISALTRLAHLGTAVS